MSLARKECRSDFPEVWLQLLDPSEWKLAAYCGFFREENIIILEARSILYAVRFAESRYLPERFLILSDNHAPVLALCKGRATFFFNIAFSHASDLCVCFQGSIYPVVQVDTFGIELLREGKSFF